MRKTTEVLVLCLLALGLFLTVTAEASNHSFIEGPLKTGPEVTKVCLECHEDAASNIMMTSHWTWTAEQVIDGKTVQRGKADTVNNFCISIRTNEPRCTSCHIGYGWKDNSFDLSDASKVDCLVCHDTTGKYKKTPTGAGMPDEKVDLLAVAQNVGATSRQTCGACHFFGGGGDAVKHGDLDSSLTNPTAELDVHMAADGNDFTCTSCHETTDHKITGNAMVVSPKGQNHIGCVGCHEGEVHSESLINQHLDTVACQTCHIPYFAKEVPTKTSWDWSTAGQDIKPEKDQYGKPNYDKKKGNFTWGMMITPEYAWYDGTAGVYQLGDKIDPTQMTLLSYPNGKRSDKEAKIYPFKLHTGKQIYDSKNLYFMTPKLFGKGGFWATNDWDAASKIGMNEVGLDYSGEYGFAPTAMYWRINHMVAPKEQALGCLDCHGDNGRMDWKALGYTADPIVNQRYARTKN